MLISQIKRKLVETQDGIFHFVKMNIQGRVPHNHIMVLYALRELMGDECKTYLEIGVHNGGSMCVVMQSHYPCVCTGVDMFEEVLKIPRYQYFAADNLCEERTRQNIDRLNEHGHPWEIIRGNSRHKSTIQKVKDRIGETEVDLLFIDGDHSYDAVKDDFTNYGSLVRTGGIVVFDDYAPGHPEITKFINELNDPNWIKIGSTPNEFIIQRT